VLNVSVIFDVGNILLYFYYGFYVIYSPSYIRRMYYNSRFCRLGKNDDDRVPVIAYTIMCHCIGTTILFGTGYRSGHR
jgi:hypothetical protein